MENQAAHPHQEFPGVHSTLDSPFNIITDAKGTDDNACDAISWDPCGNGDEIELLVLQPRIKSNLSLRCDQVPDIFFSSPDCQ